MSIDSNCAANRNSCFGSVRSFVVTATLFAALFLSLTGCGQADGAGSSGGSSENKASVMIDSVNYMHERAVQYTLYDLSKTTPQAIGGSIVDMLASGGDKGCCLALPKTWRPGIKVRLDWQESDRQRTYPEKYSREMEVPRYEAPSDLYVVFYPKHAVELVVSVAEPGHPDWRGSIKQGPWDQCVQEFGRKPCKAALPKQFDTKSSLGTCKYMRDEHLADADLLCLALTQECLRDYEDQQFCDGIVWGERQK